MRNTTLPLIKYGVQYIPTYLKFIWSAPNYFIIQPLGGRLTSCKMATNGQEKAFCVLHFHVSRSVLTVSESFVHDLRKNHQRRTLSEVGMINSSEQAVFVRANRQVGLRLPRQLWKELESLFNVVRRNLQRERAESLVFPKQLCGAYCVSV